MKGFKAHIIILFLLFLMAGNAVFGQYNTTNPIVRVGAGNRALYSHGTNHTDLLGVLAGESVDSVTVSAEMPYFVMPQQFFNPNYNLPVGNAPFDASELTSLVLSAFTWGVFTDAGLSIASGHTATALGPVNKNYYSVTWDETVGVGTYYLGVEELPDPSIYSVNCNDGENSIQVEVINKPTIEFANDGDPANGGEFGQAVCFGDVGDDGSLSYRQNGTTTDFLISFASDVSGNQDLEVRYEIECLSYSAGATIPYNAGHNVNTYYPIEVTGANSGILRISDVFRLFGEYTITITHVRDRIANKSNVICPVDASSFQEVYTLIINPIPENGELQSIENTYHND